MTKLEELKAARDAARASAYDAASAVSAAQAASDWAAYAVVVASAAYEAELTRIQKENSND